MKHLIFDFDGTLVDSLPVIIEIAQEMVPNVDLSPKRISELREMPAKAVIKEAHIPYWQLAHFVIRGRRLLAKRLDELVVFPGMVAVLQQLHQAGYQLCVVSSNSEDNIRRVLRREGIEDYFAGVYGNIGLFNKTRAFRVVLRDQKTTAQNALYIGDEVRDIEAARKGHIDIISVTWGYNGAHILEEYQPTYLAHTPKDLLTIIKQSEATKE